MRWQQQKQLQQAVAAAVAAAAAAGAAEAAVAVVGSGSSGIGSGDSGSYRPTAAAVQQHAVGHLTVTEVAAGTRDTSSGSRQRRRRGPISHHTAGGITPAVLA